MLNLTLIALSTSYFHGLSPMFLPSRSKTIFSLKAYQLNLNFFSCSAFHSNKENFQFFMVHSSFSNFLQSPIVFEKSDELIITKEKYDDTLMFSELNKTTVYIVTCFFANCTSTKRGGAIRYIKDGILTIHESIFEQCSSSTDGGAIFACKTEGSSGAEMTHQNAALFDSLYCCYSKCSAKGYGNAMLVAAREVKLFYSSSSECPFINGGESISEGAQFDLRADNIESRFINASAGSSKFCASMEYRGATKGFFQYQTVTNQKGGFITSFTNLETNVKIDSCNFINESVSSVTDVNVNSGVLHIRKRSIEINNFCFVGISFSGDTNKCRLASLSFDAESSGKTITLQNCIIEKIDDKYLENIQHINKNNSFIEDSISTLDIPQLNLGECKGVVTAPPIFEDNITNLNPDDSPIFENETTTLGPNENSKIEENSEKDSLKIEVIIGIVAAVLVGLIIIIVAIFLVVKKRQKVSSGGVENTETIKGNDKPDTLQTENPLYDNIGNDPFKEDFDEQKRNGSFVL